MTYTPEIGVHLVLVPFWKAPNELCLICISHSFFVPSLHIIVLLWHFRNLPHFLCTCDIKQCDTVVFLNRGSSHRSRLLLRFPPDTQQHQEPCSHLCLYLQKCSVALFFTDYLIKENAHLKCCYVLMAKWSFVSFCMQGLGFGLVRHNMTHTNYSWSFMQNVVQKVLVPSGGKDLTNDSPIIKDVHKASVVNLGWFCRMSHDMCRSLTLLMDMKIIFLLRFFKCYLQ